MASVSHFRGHLFADLRGYTSFIERAGNAAGAELVSRFRQLVRDEVADHQGAVVKTEGDAIYVVFPSASTAVTAGLSIAQRAAAMSAQEPDLPINVGVGIHAGEAVEVPEGGYIGTAVNLAARVCAVADAGEVLVTGTVRGIVQASIPVRFVPRGRRRLKGISERVELYRAVPAGTAVRTFRGVDRRWLAPAAAALAALAVLAASFALWPRGATVAPRSVEPLPSGPVANAGPLAVGDYRLRVFRPPLGFTIATGGWALDEERSAYAEFTYDNEPRGRVALLRITGIYEDPCNATFSRPVGATPDELIAALRETPYLVVGEPIPVEVDSRFGSQVDITISASVFAACDLIGGVGLFPLGPDALAADPADRIRLAAVDVGGRTVSMVMIIPEGVEMPVNAIELFYQNAQQLIDSIDF